MVSNQHWRLFLYPLNTTAEAITKVLDDAGIAIFGATTNGEFIDDSEEYDLITILLLDVNPDYFKILIAEYPEKNYRQVAAVMAKKTMEFLPNPAFLIAGTNTDTDAEQLLLGFEDIAGSHVNIHGCMAGDNFSFTKQIVFTNEGETHLGLLMLAFNQDKIKIRGRAICGWNAVGTVRTVTKSIGNHVFTVDDIPVLELTAKYGGFNLQGKVEKVMYRWRHKIPLQLQKGTGKRSGNETRADVLTGLIILFIATAPYRKVLK